MSCTLAFMFVACFALVGCDIARDQYRAYKQSRMVEVGCFPFGDADNANESALLAKMSRCPVKVEMESTLGIMSIYVDRADVSVAREWIRHDRDLQQRGVRLID
ncbi:MAG TPA: hypothetical protein VFB96_18160 [Pirellulaceae bacterium]|nr:hypothetical protein [Pirellulaceae bacterium]